MGRNIQFLGVGACPDGIFHHYTFLGHPSAQGRVLATLCQCKHWLSLVGHAPDLIYHNLFIIAQVGHKEKPPPEREQ